MRNKNIIIIIVLITTIKANYDCLYLNKFIDNYNSDISDCHKYLSDNSIILKKKGEGSFGTVYSCNIKLPQGNKGKFAMKELDRSLIPEELIEDEIMSLNNLNMIGNIGFPIYYGCIASNTHVYIFMEELEIDFYDLIFKEGNYKKDMPNVYDDLSIMLEMFIILSRSLRDLNNSGFSHYDIKLRNIMIKSGFKTAKIVDYGFMYPVNTALYQELLLDYKIDPHSVKYSKFTTRGTPSYTDPFLLIYRKDHILSDIYSLGLTFIEILLGEIRNDMPSAPVATKLLWTYERNMQYYQKLTEKYSAQKDLVELLISMITLEIYRRPSIESVINKLQDILRKVNSQSDVLDEELYLLSYHNQHKTDYSLNLFVPREDENIIEPYIVKSYEKLLDMINAFAEYVQSEYHKFSDSKQLDNELKLHTNKVNLFVI